VRSDLSEKDNTKNKKDLQNKNKKKDLFDKNNKKEDGWLPNNLKKVDKFERVKDKVEFYGRQRFRDTISEIYDDEEK